MIKGAGTKEELRFCKLTRFGATLAIVAAISITSIETFKRVGFLQGRLLYGVLTLVGAGVVLSLCDLDRYRRKTTAEEVLQFHSNPHYWGMVLLLSAAVFYAFMPAVATAAQPEVVQPCPRSEPAAVPIRFPDLWVSAVVVNGNRSSAIINRKVVGLGEDVQGARLVRVTGSSIEVELKGARKEFVIGQGAAKIGRR